ncbi:hypothetical protein POJ06DRAFT_234478 [Lipomyces tetrasporus]|uniref:Uncharacterized protein n=1 Tax=Lipomyces tetrasporus TaxID=54092 RepID=A0AAD7VWG6_9ASCO|nr:uncharacterized protein POJ06DRAFT_234478 [Lipomyces tetrasporus]KAJ8103465.1 hypothetical protein POJ06DRAFT_234478 [Lipomyces tetrasporus]
MTRGVCRELGNNGRGELSKRFRPLFDETRNTLDDNANESAKMSDGGLAYFNPDIGSVNMVAEVGVSETYENLFADIPLDARVPLSHCLGLLRIRIFLVIGIIRIRYSQVPTAANNIRNFIRKS